MTINFTCLFYNSVVSFTMKNYKLIILVVLCLLGVTSCATKTAEPSPAWALDMVQNIANGMQIDKIK